MSERKDFLNVPEVYIAAQTLHDAELLRIASEGRYRSGLERLSPHHPAMRTLAESIVDDKALEEKRTKILETAMKEKQPIWTEWACDIHGMGLKSLGRLLGAIGDPYWNVGQYVDDDGNKRRRDRPRKKGELAAYCGVHVGDSGQAPVWRPRPKNHKGEWENPDGKWKSEARIRIWLVADGLIKLNDDPRLKQKQAFVTSYLDIVGSDDEKEIRKMSAVKLKASIEERMAGNDQLLALHQEHFVNGLCATKKSPYSDLFEETCAKYAAQGHSFVCARCGTKGKPAPVGSPHKPLHLRGIGRRRVMRQVLDDLWDVSKKLHEERASQ